MPRVCLVLGLVLLACCHLISAELAPYEYLGCFEADNKDSYDSVDFPHGQLYSGGITIITCLTYCQTAYGDSFASVRNLKVCRCGNAFNYTAPLPASECQPCALDPATHCGDADAVSVYSFTGSKAAAKAPAPATITPALVSIPANNPGSNSNPVSKRRVDAVQAATTGGSSTTGGIGSSNTTATGSTTGNLYELVTEIIAQVEMTGDFDAFNLTAYCIKVATGLNLTIAEVICVKILTSQGVTKRDVPLLARSPIVVSDANISDAFSVKLTIDLPQGSPLLTQSNGNNTNAGLIQLVNTVLASPSVQTFLNASGVVAQAPTVTVSQVYVAVTTGTLAVGGGGGSSNKVALGVGLGLGLGLGIPLIVVAVVLIVRRRGNAGMPAIVPPPVAEPRV